MKAYQISSMAVVLAALTGLTAAQPSEAVLSTDQHKAFFSEYLQLQSNLAAAKEIGAKWKSLDQDEKTIPKKSEFETTAQYQNRSKNKLTQIALERRETIATGNRLAEESTVASNALRRKEEELMELVTIFKVLMKPYDADAGIASFTAQSFVLGSYDDRLAAITVDCELPSISCPVAIAKKLREASEKSELICAVKLIGPRIKLTHGLLTVPATSGEKVQTGIFMFLGALLAGNNNSAPPGSYRIPETKQEAANIIKIEGFKTVEYLIFGDQQKAILDLSSGKNVKPEAPLQQAQKP